MKVEKLSIIIPVFNTERYLRQCCDSICNLSGYNFEVCLVDDGSTDSSGSICDEYAALDSRFSVIHTENHGASHARNIGIKNTTGDWISFVDSDDWVDTSYLDSLISGVNEDLVYFFINQIFTNGDSLSRIPHSSVSFERNEIEQVLYNLKYGILGDVFGWTCNKFFRRSIIESHSVYFPENVTFREDEIFTMKYCRYIKSLRVIDKTSYFYRIRNDGLTGSGITGSDYLNLASLLEDNLQYYSNKALLDSDMNRIAEYHILNFRLKIGTTEMADAFEDLYTFFTTKQNYQKFVYGNLVKRLISVPKYMSRIYLIIYVFVRKFRK